MRRRVSQDGKNVRVERSDGLEVGPRLPPVSVNWHLWPRCNYQCKFCFATFKGMSGVLSQELSMSLLRLLREAGTDKISFAGGEPTLCPYLGDMLRHAKHLGMTTMLITNGTRLTEEYVRGIARWTDWIGLSIDSASNETEASLGRGTGSHVDLTRRAAKTVKESGVLLKINTTIVAANWREDMHELIRGLSPDRWKVFQGIPIEGESDGFGREGWATRAEFRAFVRRHSDLHPVSEDAESIEGSYVMVDPAGRFFQDFDRRYRYSAPILEVGVEAALRQVGWDYRKFLVRGGIYDWRRPPRGGI